MKYSYSVAVLSLVLFAFLFTQVLVLWYISDISRRLDKREAEVVFRTIVPAQVITPPPQVDIPPPPPPCPAHDGTEVQTKSSYLYLGNARALCRSHLHGVVRRLFVSTLDKGMMPAICNNGDSLYTGWEWEMEQFYLGAVPQGGTIVEMGSNVGYFTQMFAQRFNTRHIVGIEANPLVFELLSSGMDASFSRTQWTTVNVVLAPDGGNNTARFCVIPDRPLNGFVVLSEASKMDCISNALHGTMVTIPARPASSFFTLDLEQYSLVKVDVDWAEGVVWESLAAMMRNQSKLLPLVTVEVNPDRNRHMKYFQILESMESLYGEVGMVNGGRCVHVSIKDPQWIAFGDKIACLQSRTAKR